jgi:porin
MHRRRGPRHNPCRPICTSSPISAACAAGSNGKGSPFTSSYYGDAFDNPFGGVKQEPGYDSRFAIITDGDLDKLAGWSGAKFHASIHSIFGNQFSGANLDNLMLVSNVEAPPTVRLFNIGSSRT